jgi:hypothetical protein
VSDGGVEGASLRSRFRAAARRGFGDADLIQHLAARNFFPAVLGRMYLSLLGLRNGIEIALRSGMNLTAVFRVLCCRRVA